MTAWVVVILAGAVTMTLKGGAALIGERTALLAERLQPGLAPSLLAALVMTQLWADDTAVVAARVAGVATAGALLLLRAPSLLAMAAAAAVAAGLRAVA